MLLCRAFLLTMQGISLVMSQEGKKKKLLGRHCHCDNEDVASVVAVMSQALSFIRNITVVTFNCEVTAVSCEGKWTLSSLMRPTALRLE